MSDGLIRQLPVTLDSPPVVVAVIHRGDTGDMMFDDQDPAGLRIVAAVHAEPTVRFHTQSLDEGSMDIQSDGHFLTSFPQQLLDIVAMPATGRDACR